MASIRQATETDLASICVLGEEVNALHHIESPHVFAAPGLPERSLEHWKRSILSENSVIFLAEEGQTPVGFITAMIASEVHVLMQPLRFGKIGTVGVSAAMRGRGIGRQLMLAANEWIEGQGGVQSRLTVGSFNNGAISLYKELGYEVESHNLILSLRR